MSWHDGYTISKVSMGMSGTSVNYGVVIGDGSSTSDDYGDIGGSVGVLRYAVARAVCLVHLV